MFEIIYYTAQHGVLLNIALLLPVSLSSVPQKHANGSSFIVAVPRRAARFAAKCVCSSPCPGLHTVIQSRVGRELYQGRYVRCVVTACARV